MNTSAPTRGGGASAAAIVLGLTVGACSALNHNQGDFWAPVLATGKAYGIDGAPLPNAHLRLVVIDRTAGELGEPAPDVLEVLFVTSAGGEFTLHVTPTPQLVALAERNRGSMIFYLSMESEDGQPLGHVVFHRDLAAGAWVGDPPLVQLGTESG